MDWGIAGHKKQIQLLEKAMSKDRVAHAYIFAGPDGVGKKVIAKKFAQILLCEFNPLATPPVDLPLADQPHPLEGEGNKSKGEGKVELPCDACPQCKAFSKSSNADFLEVSDPEGIKIEQIRDLTYKLSLKPYMAKYKVAVIDGAENMTIEAANALLKALEEPKPYTVIILLTSNAERLPKTISSRAQRINFGLPEGKLIIEELPEAERFYKIFISGDLAEKLKLVSELSELETTELNTTLGFWMVKLREELLTKADKSVASKLSSVVTSRRLLDQNVNAKLLLANLMLN